MQYSVSKKQIRQTLQSEVDLFLMTGGTIECIDRGVSGLPSNQPWPKTFQVNPEAKPLATRTPVPEVLANLDERQQRSKKKLIQSNPKKVWVYDDFGEPLRWIWKNSEKKIK